MLAPEAKLAGERIAQVLDAMAAIESFLRRGLAHFRDCVDLAGERERCGHMSRERERLVESAPPQASIRERRRNDEVRALAWRGSFCETFGEPAAQREITRVLEALYQSVDRESVLEHGERVIERMQ
jgi:hypothetical protein